MTRPSISKLVFRASLIAAVTCVLFLIADEVFARVGGGQSYGGGSGGGGRSGGGSGGGSSDGGAIIWLVFQAIRFLIYLTIEYPLVGIPVDMVVVGGIVYFFSRRRPSGAVGFSSMAASEAQIGEEPSDSIVARNLDRLCKFDPNFSEIGFTYFCFSLFGKGNESRGSGPAKLDLFSPYLSEAARKPLLQPNPAGIS